jgi:hypothetical protein
LRGGRRFIASVLVRVGILAAPSPRPELVAHVGDALDTMVIL